jgi:hypothetical protein
MADFWQIPLYIVILKQHEAGKGCLNPFSSRSKKNILVHPTKPMKLTSSLKGQLLFYLCYIWVTKGTDCFQSKLRFFLSHYGAGVSTVSMQSVIINWKIQNDYNCSVVRSQ